MSTCGNRLATMAEMRQVIALVVADLMQGESTPDRR